MKLNTLSFGKSLWLIGTKPHPVLSDIPLLVKERERIKQREKRIQERERFLLPKKQG